MSPRAALSLQRAARALAASVGREYVIPDDIKALVGPVLEHRLGLSPDTQLAGSRPADVLADVLAAVPVPAGRTGS
jgi:MoxR-like ATPase